MSTEGMTLERLRAIVEAYGTEPMRWPAAERDAGAALLAKSDEARALLTAAEPLDQLLDAVPPLTPTPGVRAAILAAAPRAGGQSPAAGFGDLWRGFMRELGGWRLAGAVLGAALVLGIVSGGLLSQMSTAEASPGLLQLALLDDSIAEY